LKVRFQRRQTQQAVVYVLHLLRIGFQLTLLKRGDLGPQVVAGRLVRVCQIGFGPLRRAPSPLARPVDRPCSS
jgi:hypothetical protein